MCLILPTRKSDRSQLPVGILSDLKGSDNLIAQSIFDPFYELIERYVVEPIGGFILGGLIIGTVEVYNAGKNTWEFVWQEGIPFLAIPDDSGTITLLPSSIPDINLLPGTLPFPIPEESEIEVEFFPGDINIEEVLNGSIFTNPNNSELEYSGVLTTPKEIGSLDDLINSPFVFPNEEEIVPGTRLGRFL